MALEKETIENLRKEYQNEKLSEKEVSPNPFNQFEAWFEEALKAEVLEPNAMTLATATKDGKPSARIVLLKGIDKRGISFYTNYLSRKGKELAKNPWASVVIFWPELERQVRIEGKIVKISKEESEAYFHSRPAGSQKKYEGKEIPKPAHWGGFLLEPISVEFWQGRENRLHDRLHYVLMEKGKWKIERLAP
jgi:pyridoxamine 5'-phosphate oxidase